VRRSDPLYIGVVWMSVCCECSVLSGRGLCDRLITCTLESYGCLSVVNVECFQILVCATG